VMPMVIPVHPGMIRMNLKAPMVALADIMMMILTLQPNVVFVVADLMMVVDLVVAMVNLTVAMDLVSMAHGHVTAMVTALMAQTKLIVLLHHVKIRVYGIVVMASVSQEVMYVMAQVNFVTQAGVLTVPMVQMKA